MGEREPDRYDKAALEIWGGDFTPAGFAAALRAEAADALERAAQAFAESPTTQHSGTAVASVLRYLKSPAAAPAAETGKGTCWIDPQWCAEHGQPLSVCAEQGRAPLSEPVAPAPSEAIRLVERIRATAKGHMEYFAGEIFSDANDALRILLATSKPGGAGEGT